MKKHRSPDIEGEYHRTPMWRDMSIVKDFDQGRTMSTQKIAKIGRDSRNDAKKGYPTNVNGMGIIGRGSEQAR